MSTNDFFSTESCPRWRIIQRQNFIRTKDLAAFLELTDKQYDEIEDNPQFILNLPKRIAQKMAKGTLDDPLFLQFVPLKKETIRKMEFVKDPVQDALFKKETKLLQKYHGRALLIACGACAMNCRFCFRKNFPYETEEKSFDKELEQLRKDSSLHEVLLSGGDPLSLSNNSLKVLLNDLSSIDHVKRIRFHTRFPIGIPERIDSEFIDILGTCSKQIWFVLHANHPKEFDTDIWESLKKVQKLGIPVLTQSVLLKGINDAIEVLKNLFESIVDHGILPYYLHQLDKVEGAHHFEVPQEVGFQLISELTEVLSGYAVPKFVQEIPGKKSKTLLSLP